MLEIDYLNRVGNTPLLKINIQPPSCVTIHAKLEFMNPTGSIKDRAVSYMIERLLYEGEIDINTTIIESSSGNMGISLAAYCRKYGIQFICVIDPNINIQNEKILRGYGARLVKVCHKDKYNGYLLSRIEKVRELKDSIHNSFWINQYNNHYCIDAYSETLGAELLLNTEKPEYIFVGVSSGGTIAGISRRIKEEAPSIKIIAVDVLGSVIFGGCSKKRYIPGIGSTMVPENIANATIDDIVYVTEIETIRSCYEILEKNMIFAGGSSGSCVAAIKKYFENRKNENAIVATIFADSGERYLDTIYNREWVESTYGLEMKNEVGNNERQ